MASRTVDANSGSTKVAAAAHPAVKNSVVGVKSITSTDQIEVWGDGTVWNVTTGKPICIDLLGWTGTPRYNY